MTCSTRKKNFCVDVFEVRELMHGNCSSRPPRVRFCAATITTLSAPSNLYYKDINVTMEIGYINIYTMTDNNSANFVANLLFIFPLSLAVMEESSGASGECKSACARLCCSKLYSLSSASNVPEAHKKNKKGTTIYSPPM